MKLHRNASYLAQFITGVMVLALSCSIFYFGSSSGFIYDSRGMEARIKATLFVFLAGWLIFPFFFRRESKKLGWMQAVLYLLVLGSVELLAHFMLWAVLHLAGH